ncbi:hypothetical protein MXB_706, partial [Myxobolus squamalis]
MSLCNYIEKLAERPPLLHSRDVHSSIVHAYLCIASWINHHNWMIYNQVSNSNFSFKTCLQSFLQIIELGLTGNKSKDSQSVKKETKQQKPISFRVYDSAEYLMFLLLELFPSRGNLKKYAPSTINESEILHTLFLKILLFFHAIIFRSITIVSYRRYNTDPKCVVFVHGIMGKHLYEFEFNSALHPKVTTICIIAQPPTDFLNNNVAAYLPNDLSKLSDHYQLQLSNTNSGVKSYQQNLMYAAEHGVRKLSSEKLHYLFLFILRLNSSHNSYRMLFSNLSFLNYDIPE